MDGDELEWNMAGNRIKFIASITMRVRAAYSNYLTEQDIESLRGWFNMVSSLYEELRIYIPETDEYDKKELDEEIDTLRSFIVESNEQTAFNHDDRLRTFDRKLQEIRKIVGLDIPSKTSLDPDSALTDGLR